MTQVPDRASSSTKPIITRFLSHHLWSSPGSPTMGDAVRGQNLAYEKARILVRAYYVLSAYVMVTSLSGWPGYLNLQRAEPLWPANWWFPHVSALASVNIVFCFYLGASLVAMLLPELRIARIAYAVALLEYMALVNTADKINHNLHAWFFVSIVLILLPRGPWRSERRIGERQWFLTVFWVAMLVTLFFYTLTGTWKIYESTHSLLTGGMSGFNFSGFSYIVGNRLLQTSQQTVLGHFFVHHVYPGWLLFIGTMYLETFSIIIAFRPRLHRIWGAGLILFHIGTQLAMGFTFPQNIILLGLFFVCSPFTPSPVSIKDTITDLPGLYFISRRVAALRDRRATAASRGAGLEPVATG